MKITDAIQEFILYKQSLGMSYKNRALKLNAFARCAGPIEIDSVDPETVRRFLDGDRPITTEWFNKFSALKMFFRFALSRGYATRNPLPISQPKSPRQFRPYIYSMEEVQNMIRVVDTRHRGNWHLEPCTIRTLILLLYGTGLRIGEAIRLQHRDVDFSDMILTGARNEVLQNTAGPGEFGSRWHPSRLFREEVERCRLFNRHSVSGDVRWTPGHTPDRRASVQTHPI